MLLRALTLALARQMRHNRSRRGSTPDDGNEAIEVGGNKRGLTMSSFARAKASLSRLHILEVPLYTFLQKKWVQYQGY